MTSEPALTFTEKDRTELAMLSRVLKLRMREVAEYEVWRLYPGEVEYRYTESPQ